MDTELSVRNVSVNFPGKPYEGQIKIIDQVIHALQTVKTITYFLCKYPQKQNILVESPTGTGKTLSLLCSTLAWLKSVKINDQQAQTEERPKIIYATRTHSQISQLIKELKSTKYNTMKVCFLASREILCINDRVLNANKSSNDNIVIRSRFF